MGWLRCRYLVFFNFRKIKQVRIKVKENDKVVWFKMQGDWSVNVAYPGSDYRFVFENGVPVKCDFQVEVWQYTVEGDRTKDLWEKLQKLEVEQV